MSLVKAKTSCPRSVPYLKEGEKSSHSISVPNLTAETQASYLTSGLLPKAGAMSISVPNIRANTRPLCPTSVSPTTGDDFFLSTVSSWPQSRKTFTQFLLWNSTIPPFPLSKSRSFSLELCRKCYGYFWNYYLIPIQQFRFWPNYCQVRLSLGQF